MKARLRFMTISGASLEIDTISFIHCHVPLATSWGNISLSVVENIHYEFYSYKLCLLYVALDLLEFNVLMLDW